MPLPQRTYDDQRLQYHLAIDLTNCGWWDRSPIQLEAMVDRLDPAEGHGAASFVVCVTERAESSAGTADAGGEQAGGEAANGDHATPNSAACNVEVTVDHPSVEAAHYHGEISFPWEGGRRTVAFNALCGPGAGCVDLPVDPTSLLGPVGNLGGGDGDVG
jgi:hypothetical protein